MDQSGPYVLFTLVSYSLCIALEVFFAYRRNLSIYDRQNTIANTLVFFGFVLVSAFWQTQVVLKVYTALQPYALFNLGTSVQEYVSRAPWWSYVLLFFLEDFCYYVFHRVSHKVAFLWGLHETHHSSNYYNLSVSAREPWLYMFAFLFWTPLVLLGFHPVIIIQQQWINVTYQLFIHTPLVGKLGFLEWFLNTPSNHRVHHGTDTKYVDRNFGGILIIWDRMFGTYQREEETPTYGISPPLHSNSVFVIVFNGLWRYLRGLRSAP